jgi:hypothetical protein
LLNLELQVVVSNSMRRKGPKKWRFLLGLSVLGFLIIASAANAANRVHATGDAMQIQSSCSVG